MIIKFNQHAILKCRIFLLLSFMCAYTTTASAIEFQQFDARQLALGGAMSSIADQINAFSNPAARAITSEKQSVFFNLPAGGVSAQPRRALRKNILDLQQAIKIGNDSDSQMQLAHERLRSAQDKRAIYLGGGASLPFTPLSLAATFNGYYLEKIDANKSALTEPPPSSSPFSSEVELKALAIIESGISLAHVVDSTQGGSNRLSIGLNAKMISVKSYYYRENAETLNYDNATKATRNQSFYNLDLGLIKEFNFVWKWGAYVRNLFPATATYANGAKEYFFPQLRSGVSYRSTYGLSTVDVDVTKQRDFYARDNVREFSLGQELIITSFLKIRAGASTNLHALKQSQLALGLGIDLKHFRFDVGARGNRSWSTVLADFHFIF